MAGSQVEKYELQWWNGMLVGEQTSRIKLIGPPVYYSGLSQEMIERMTMIS
jgi:hypothetical protein